ncbi:hypothetical protein BC832DRAFT_450942 [Gaertneriomyces semiglobifer]|nr:hypothetical protein BC832DRAFT_450942 [Gaertneriomyces semiglobifer]
MDVNEPPKHLIGKYLVTPSKTLDEILAKGIDRANVVTKDDLPPSHRIIPPGGMVTMDYRPTRLNVHISGGETPTITGVNYG